MLSWVVPSRVNCIINEKVTFCGGKKIKKANLKYFKIPGKCEEINIQTK